MFRPFLSSAMVRRLRHAGAREVALCATGLLALIFVLDIGSGASLSFSPFYMLPVALCAWRLGRGATLLAVLGASGARVLDFYLMRQRDGAAMLLYDLLQSAAFYGLAALLTWQVRDLVQRLLRHSSSLQRKARLARHRHRLEATIRRAVLADVPAIVQLTTLAGEAGGFDAAVTDSARQATLADAFRQGITEGAAMRELWTGGQSVVPIEFWVSEMDGELAAYMMVLGLDGNKGPERELHAVSVAPRFRQRGVGAALVNFFCTHYQHRSLVVACHAGSLMMQMLQRRSFQPLGDHRGYQVMARS